MPERAPPEALDDQIRRTEESNLPIRERALYGKLHASRTDIEIARSCAQYIKKQRWHEPSLFRSATVRIQQISFTTTMIVAYTRPFAPGRGNVDLPKRLISDYESEHKNLHNRLLRLRCTEYAHSDALSCDVTPYAGDLIMSIETIRDDCFSKNEIDLFLLMTDGLLARISERMEQLRLGRKSGA